MPLDGIAANYLTQELHRLLTGARVDRVHQTDRNDLVLSLRNAGSNHRLLVSARADTPRLHMTESTYENPAYPPMFCMLLRKHLIGSRIESVTCQPWERIFTFHFLGSDELGDRKVRKLVVEIMGRHSNIILLNSDDVIIDAATHVNRAMSRVRQVLPSLPYSMPPAQNKMSPESAIERLIENPLSVFHGGHMARNVELSLLQAYQGFSPPLCREVCHRAGIDGKADPSALTESDRMILGNAMLSLLQHIVDGECDPYIYRKHKEDPVPSDFHILPFASIGFREKRSTLSSAMDEFFSARVNRNRIEQRKRGMAQSITTHLTRAVRKADAHRSDLRSCDEYQDLRQNGELILSNLHALKEGIPGFHATDYTSENEDKIWVSLDPNRSLSTNAQNYFRKYVKAKSRIENATTLLHQDEEAIAYLRTLLTAVDNAVDTYDLDAVRLEWDAFDKPGKDDTKNNMNTSKKKGSKHLGKNGKGGRKKPGRQEKSTSKPRTYTSSDGFTLLVGRNNLQNDRLTLKTADREDLWFHIQKQPGTHVVVRTGKRIVPDRTLLEAAETAAWFSRPGGGSAARQISDSGSLAVDYCPAGHVRKPSGARPGMVIYDNYRTLMVQPKDPARLHAREESSL